MPTKPKLKSRLTPLELRIMQALWSSGASTVQSIQSALHEELAYTTVQTVLNTLHRKGHVTRTLAGRAFRYQSVDSKEIALGSVVRDLLSRVFDGSVEDLLMNLVRTRQVDATKLAELAHRISITEGDPDADPD